MLIGYSNATLNNNYHQWALGRYNLLQAYGDDVLALGSYNAVTADECITIGHNLLGTTYHALFGGRYNIGGGSRYAWNANEYLFAMGNGTGTGANANNAISIYKNGDAELGDRDASTKPIMKITTADSTTELIGC